MKWLPPLLAALGCACAGPEAPIKPAVPPSPGAGGEGQRVVRRLSAMGTSLEIEVQAADRSTALLASEAAVRALEATEGRLSTWREESELTHLNQTPVGIPRELSQALARELGRARELWIETDGAFDPGVGPLVAAWDLRGRGRIPPPGELAAALEASGLRHLELEGTRALRTHPRFQIEEGGFGKGAGLDLAREAALEAGASRGAITLGGQWIFFGPPPFELSVAAPQRRDEPLLRLVVDGGSVATSGDSQRGRQVDGKSIGHILDPRSGRPAPDFGSVTVCCDSALDADAFSTALFVLGPESALDFAAEHESLEVVVIETLDGEGRRVRVSSGLRGRVTLLPSPLPLTLETP